MLFLWLSLLFTLPLGAKTVCLNMIVKNEAPVIERCLATVKPHIDYWVIVDTGSNDGTQKIIRSFLKDIPGELHEQKWVNFGHNRNEALKLAKEKSDYILLIDADEVLEGTFDKSALREDAYTASVRVSTSPFVTLQRGFLLADRLSWWWKGAIHEQLQCTVDFKCTPLSSIVISAEAKDGNRSKDPQKYIKDAELLEKAVLDEPDNSNYVYYLAQSYHTAQKFELALQNYEKLTRMEGGWDQYVFWAKYQIASLQEFLGKEEKVFLQSYSEAFRFRPTRLEPLFCLALHYFKNKNYILSFALAELGSKIPVPDDRIYIEHWIYSYGIKGLLANSALEMKWYEKAAPLYEEIAKNEKTPADIRSQAKETLTFIRKANALAREIQPSVY